MNQQPIPPQIPPVEQPAEPIAPVNPALASVLQQKDPDTFTWFKG